MSKLELTFGMPNSGWLPTKLKTSDIALTFNASNIPENPIDQLCESLILALNGIETEMNWDLEPESYIFGLKPSGKEIDFNILKSGGLTKKRTLIYKLNGDFQSVILPMYRSLKKFNSLEYKKTDWTKIDQTKLDKLTKLVADRKNYLQHRL
ncbi:hypothetical protein NYZ99_11260 [Maribacter litopenaei]|uniref:Uncharacterized protein n=1 Tax=Maribacter litopenaei TaxID=2976127 RepID=A0ABY5Y3Z7_9FLAO|nr:hypothetical protein [Maribacter litopenaei]UWX53726.1 hypothetical protein NYZ99_11260 [Maribacter litopenaei]